MLEVRAGRVRIDGLGPGCIVREPPLHTRWPVACAVAKVGDRSAAFRLARALSGVHGGDKHTAHAQLSPDAPRALGALPDHLVDSAHNIVVASGVKTSPTANARGATQIATYIHHGGVWLRVVLR